MDDARGSSLELTAEQCRALLTSQAVGRVAFVTPQGPRIVPVNYGVHDDVVEFRTTSYSELALHAPGTPVAFEVDELDPSTRSGWSVVVAGHCERALDDVDPTLAGSGSGHREETGATPWAGGRRPLVLRVALDEVTGRRVGQGEWHHADAERA